MKLVKYYGEADREDRVIELQSQKVENVTCPEDVGRGVEVLEA